MKNVWLRFSPCIVFGVHKVKKWKVLSGGTSKTYTWFEVRYESYFFAFNCHHKVYIEELPNMQPSPSAAEVK